MFSRKLPSYQSYLYLVQKYGNTYQGTYYGSYGNKWGFQHVSTWIYPREIRKLLTVLDTWQGSIENGYDIDCIYVDFMKAFDTVPQERLIGEMKSYGIFNPMLGWMESFYRIERNTWVSTEKTQT